MADSATLSEKELRFCAEYAAEPNATQAYLRAYDCAYTTANTEGCKLLVKPCIAAEIEAARKEYRRTCGVKFAKVVRKLAAIAFNDPDDFFEADADNCGLPKPRPWAKIKPRARKNILTVKLKRKRLRSAKKNDDCLYEIEELDYKMLDPMAALALLCQYLGVTKGSLTVDELRSMVAGTAAPGSVASGPAGAEGGATDGADKPVVRPAIDPDE